MAIRRLAEKLEKSFVVKTKFDEETNVIVQSDLIEIVVYKTEDVQKQIKQLYDLVDFRKGDFLTITQGLHEVMIIANKKYEKKIIVKFSEKSIKKLVKDLSSLTINIPETSVETVGLFYTVARALNWENINIVDIVSTFTEMTFIVNENDTSKAFESLKKLISSNRS
jgi:aspartokinase